MISRARNGAAGRGGPRPHAHGSPIPILALGLLLLPAAASASVGFRGWGPRIGFTLDPDQIHFGAHVHMGEFTRNLRFQPNLELGLGDDLTLFAINFETAYHFETNWTAWRPYAGGGLGINIWDVDHDPAIVEKRSHAARSPRLLKTAAHRHADSDTELGVNLLAGIERSLAGGDRFLFEFKLGLSNSPDIKLAVGWIFD
jgi:hypothetical protein